MKRRVILFLTAAWLPAGCVDRPPEPGILEPPRSIRAPAATAPTPGEPLVVTAPHSCMDGASAQIAWSVDSPGMVDIWVSGPGSGEAKLWRRASPRGQASTPPWARDGMIFSLRRAESGEVLAEAALDCY
jgi:hypothetical protein